MVQVPESAPLTQVPNFWPCLHGVSLWHIYGEDLGGNATKVAEISGAMLSQITIVVHSLWICTYEF